MYFEVYAVASNLKTRFAALNFTSAAASWLHTFEKRGHVLDWEQFCDAVFQCFDKDQYKIHLRQLDTLHQDRSVPEHLQCFEELSHGILLYNPTYDDTYFVTRFLGGLKEEIRAPIALHQPKDVAAASALALLQEEEIEKARKKSSFRQSRRFFTQQPSVSDKSRNG
jgi:hypothetical protein